jgi:hypothetical protein
MVGIDRALLRVCVQNNALRSQYGVPIVFV